MNELRYSVPGIGCAHCGQAITAEVEKVVGVTAVDVDIDAKTVAVHCAAMSESAVRAAIVEAGYEATRAHQ